MLEALIGFAGVLVGGFLNGRVTAWQEQRKQRSAAWVAALLVTEELLESMSILIFVRKSPRWIVFRDAKLFGRRSRWETHRATLAAAVSTVAFTNLSSAYQHLEHALELVQRHAGSDEEIGEDEGRDLALAFIYINRALNRTGDVVSMPPRRHPRGRHAFRKAQQAHLAKLDADEAALGGTRVRQLIDETRAAKRQGPLDL